MTTTTQKPTRSQTGSRKHKKTRGMLVERPSGWIYAILAAIVGGSVFPLYWSFVIASTNSGNASARIPVLVPGGNFFKNAAKVIDTVPFWTSMLNSIIVSTIVTVSVVFFSTLAGYAFAKLPFRGKGALQTFIILTLAVPPQLGAVGLYRLMADWGWTGKLGAVIFPVLVSAFGVYFMSQYLKGVLPTELIEAARVDGAGQFRTFLTVAIPAAKPAMAVLALFTFISTWTDFFWPYLVLRDPKVQTLQTALAQLWAAAGNSPDMAVILAGSLMSIVPLLLLFFVAGKQLVAGIMSGAVKS